MFHSCLAEEFAKPFEAHRIWSPRIRLGSLILNDQEAICHGQESSQEEALLPNKMQDVCHENSIDGGKIEARTLQIRQNLSNFDPVMLVRNFR